MTYRLAYERDPTSDDGLTIDESLNNLLYCNNNPEGDPCPICEPDIGRVFVPGTEPHVPRHDNCYCYYIPTQRPPTQTREKPR